MGPLSPHIAGHIALHGSRLLHGQEDLWKRTRRSHGGFEGEFGCLWNAHEHHSSSSSSSRKIHIWDSLGELFEEMKRLICELSEILDSRIPEFVGLKIIELEDITWRTTSLLCERASQIISANVYIFSDSVLSMGEMRDVPNAAWMNKIKLYSDNNHFKELNRIDDMQTEFEWKIF